MPSIRFLRPKYLQVDAINTLITASNCKPIAVCDGSRHLYFRRLPVGQQLRLCARYLRSSVLVHAKMGNGGKESVTRATRRDAGAIGIPTAKGLCAGKLPLQRNRSIAAGNFPFLEQGYHGGDPKGTAPFLSVTEDFHGEKGHEVGDPRLLQAKIPMMSFGYEPSAVCIGQTLISQLGILLRHLVAVLIVTIS